MKTLKFPLMIMIFGLLTLNLASCNKDDDGGDGGSAPVGTIQAKIDVQLLHQLQYHLRQLL